MTDANDPTRRDPETDAVERALGRLAESDRAAPGAGFEDRLFVASRRALAEGSAPDPVIARVGPRRGAWRLAASVALAAGATATLLLLAPSTGPRTQSADDLTVMIETELLELIEDPTGDAVFLEPIGLEPIDEEVLALGADLEAFWGDETSDDPFDSDDWEDLL